MSKNQTQRFDDFVDGLIKGSFDFSKKDRCINQHVKYMLNRTQSMFKYSGLPETIPERILELYLQSNGNVCFYEHEGNLYVFTGGLGGYYDVYYMPTIYTISNPALNLSVNAKIGDNCVVVPNDTLYMGLLPIYTRYAHMMTETELSIKIAAINSRMFSLISASDDRTKDSAQEYIKKIIDGELSVVGENAFIEGVRVQPYAGSNASNIIINLIELEQYFKASWFNELGLNANYNMKRESLNSYESQLNNDALLPLVDDMLRCRKKGIEQVNEMFGTNISVSLASSWEDNQIEIDSEQNAISGQSENPTKEDSKVEIE